MWDAGFEVTLQPAIIRNASLCNPIKANETTQQKYMARVMLENCLEGARNLMETLVSRNVPCVSFEDDAVLVTRLGTLHRFLDAHADYDMLPLGACNYELRRFACGHALYTTPRAAFNLLRRVRNSWCNDAIQLMDIYAWKNTCNRGNYYRCGNLHELHNVKNELYPLTAKNRSRLSRRFYGYGLFLQDRWEDRQAIKGKASLHERSGLSLCAQNGKC